KRAYCLKTQPATGETYPKSDLFNKASARLKDPYSARYDFNEPFKGWCKSGFTTYYGWLVPFTLNAKNSYGGYVGNKSYLYLVNKNNAIDYTASFQVGGCGKS
ncbi:hypothetical protein LVT17_27945, partial [Klebsiella pneumoniae]|nr:hypothetical protein [Klebsiella pneumoniae]